MPQYNVQKISTLVRNKMKLINTKMEHRSTRDLLKILNGAARDGKFKSIYNYSIYREEILQSINILNNLTSESVLEKMFTSQSFKTGKLEDKLVSSVKLPSPTFSITEAKSSRDLMITGENRTFSVAINSVDVLTIELNVLEETASGYKANVQLKRKGEVLPGHTITIENPFEKDVLKDYFEIFQTNDIQKIYEFLKARKNSGIFSDELSNVIATLGDALLVKVDKIKEEIVKEETGELVMVDLHEEDLTVTVPKSVGSSDLVKVNLVVVEEDDFSVVRCGATVFSPRASSPNHIEETLELAIKQCKN